MALLPGGLYETCFSLLFVGQEVYTPCRILLALVLVVSCGQLPSSGGMYTMQDFACPSSSQCT